MFRTLSIAAALFLAACGTDQPEPISEEADNIELVDTDGDGTPDGVDIDGDGAPDIPFNLPCDDPIIDDDGDGRPDGVDLDCDGIADLVWCSDRMADAGCGG